MYYIWIFLQIIIGYTLVFPLILLLFSILRGRIKVHDSQSHDECDFAIIVTAYEQTNLLPDVVNALLKLEYSNYLVYIVADNCDITDLNFNNEKVILLKPENTIASNVGSHFYAIENFRRDHERLTIIDSDNIVAPNYLKELNIYFDQGFASIQGIRKPKNLETPLAAIDAFRDLYYHCYDGHALFKAGSSSTLSGSGMAFTVDLYKTCMTHHKIKGAGFDKVLQYEIVRRNIRIAFANKAVVYDQKSSKASQLVHQRSRWLYTWMKYFRFGFGLIKSGIEKISVNQLLFGIVLLRPPLFLTLIMSLICVFANMAIDLSFVLIWIALLFCFLISFLIPLLQQGVDRRIYKSLVHIPRFIYYQVVSLIKIKTVSKRHLSTRHENI